MAEIINQGSKPKARQQANTGGVPITDILYRTLHYWPWVLLSLIVCVGVGFIYLLRTPNVYTTTASILIKDEAKGKSAGLEDFGNMGLFRSKTNIQNEISMLKSADLMEEVVRRLDLNMNYYIPGRFHDKVAYGSTLPVNVKIPMSPENESAKFDITVTPEGKVTIDNLVSGGMDFEAKYTGVVGDTIETGIGPMVVTQAEAWQPDKEVNLKVRKSPVAAIAASYDGRLGVSMMDEKGTIINMSITDQSTQRAQDVLSTLIGVYNEYWIRDKNQIAISTSNFINDRLGVIESELGNVDSDISAYKSEHLIPNIDAASSMYMSQNQQISQEIMNLNNQLQMTRYIRSYLTADGSNEKLLPTNSGVDNMNIQSQITEYNNMVLQRNALVDKSSEKNPLAIQLNEQMNQMRQAILASVDNSIVALTTQIKNLQGTQATTTSKIASNPTQAKYLLSVERQQKVKESLYLFLLQKREENELSQAFTAYNTRIVNKPSSYGPTSPNARNILMISFLIGLVIPFAIIYLREINNTKVRGRKDVESLNLPFVGEIPQYAPRRGDTTTDGERRIVVKHKSRNIINEAFRVLRTNLEFMKVNHDGANVIAITSFNPSSGKSFITVNLGMALAIKNKHVLLIDGDMRHGSTSSLFNSPETGLSDYLSGAVDDLSSIIVSSPDAPDTLSVIPIGKVPPNPTELLESPRFAAMIKALRNSYDYILIDCPPIEVVADTQIIDQQADRTIFVVRAGLLERAILPDLDRLYEEKKYHNMAFILNGTRNDQGRYGYSHTYRYGYGYGYGYGYNYGDSKKK